MLIELRNVEVHVEPEKVLTEALQEGDILISHVISLCTDEEDVEAVLNAIDNDDIRSYCDIHRVYSATTDFEAIANGIKDFTKDEKAKLLWLLLKCEG